jgi:subtilisin-like proprotein convertase family protein
MDCGNSYRIAVPIRFGVSVDFGSFAICLLSWFLCGLGAFAATCSAPPTGIVGWWPGDGNSTTLVGTNNGTLQSGATATGVGMVGQAFSFNGSTAYIQIPDSPDLRPTNLTVEAWVLFTSLNSSGNSTAGQQYIVFKQNTRTSNFEGFYLGKKRQGSRDNFAFVVSSSSGSSAEVDSSTAIATNVWYHVAAVRGSNFIQLYVNGASVRQATVNFAQNYGNYPLYFGTSGESYWDHKLAGLLDEVSLYNRALSASEIAAIYNAGAAGKCKPVAAPIITTQPQSQILAVGGAVGFSVAASGAAPLSYQWQLNGGPIPNATSTSLSLNNVQTSDSGNYSVVVTNSVGASTSAVAVLSVLLPPSIASQPQSLTTVAGNTANFSASATGSSPMNYQWRFNGSNFSNGARVTGATSTALAISTVQGSDAGNYTLVVSNPVGVVTSAVAVLTVNGPPTITAQPTGQSVLTGANVSFNVTVSGTAPLSYQWLFNGTALNDGGQFSGTTTSTLALTNVQNTNAGSYSVVITNVVGAVTSSAVLLSISSPANAATFTNSALIAIPDSGTATPYPSTIDVSGMAGVVSKVTLSLKQLSHTYIHDVDVLLAGPAGQRTLVFAHVGGTLGVTNITLSFDDAASASLPPSSQVVAGTFKPTNGGGTVSFPSPAPAAPYGATLSVFNGTAPNGTWSLYVLDDSAGDKGTISGGWTLSITSSNSPPTIVTQPASQTVAVGATASFNVTAAGTTPLSYQWLFNGTVLTNGGQINGATASTLAFSNVQSTNAGNFSVVITNVMGAITSSAALLSISSPANSATFTNTTLITIPDSGTATPYPSTINVSGMAGTVTKVTLNLKQLSHTYIHDVNVLLVGPNGQNTLVFSHVGGTLGVTNITLNFDDASGASLPASSQVVSGTFKPTNGGGSVTFPSPAPGPSYGVALSVFNGSTPNGTWSLYVLDDAVNDKGTISGGWTLSITSSNLPPTIVAQPASQTVAVGATVNLTVTASGTAPLSYQWQMNVSPIANATNNSLTLSNVQSSDSGNYSVVVNNSVGSTTSAAAVLSVLVAPAIDLQPQDVAMLPGSTANFSASASGSLPLGYQWQLNGTNLSGGGRISGATSTMLAISSVQTSDAGNYTMVASNAVGVATSAVAVLTINGPPAITTQPTSQSVSVGANVNFTVTATGTAPLSYQWLFYGTNINDGGNRSGTASSSLTLSNVQTNDAGAYQVVVANSIGSLTGAVASLSVTQPGGQSAGAIVLVNSRSARYLDFQQFIQPYLDNFGFPYTVIDIRTNSNGIDFSSAAAIIIGHAQVDTNLAYLNATVQTNLSAAVSNGVGLVNFDNDLSTAGIGRYQFVQNIFGFSYGANVSGASATFPATEPLSTMHYITARHPTNDLVGFRSNIVLPGMTVPSGTTAVVQSGGKPLVAVARYGLGRAVQWCSYDWMISTVLGPVDGLDDVVWRGVVWAARKPIVMRGLPNFVTMRIDDVEGAFWWTHVANEVGFKPFLALFLSAISEANAADLRGLVTNGNATASIHSFSASTMFYFNHQTESPNSDNVQSNNFYVGTQWHLSHGISIGKICATHYSEIGPNAFAGLNAWGMDYVPIEVVPGTVEYATPGAPWLVGGPYRLYENPQPGQVNWPTYYADWLTVPGHSEFDGRFFNIYSEVRDVASCGEWCPDNDVAGSISRATQMAKRTLDSQVMTTIFSHEWYIHPTSCCGSTTITTNNWRAILQGITNNLASYNPLYVTLDYASQYLRATRTSKLLSGNFDSGTRQVTALLSGKTDLDTIVHVFTGQDSGISDTTGTVPTFSGSITSLVAVVAAPQAVGEIPAEPAATEESATRIDPNTSFDFQVASKLSIPPGATPVRIDSISHANGVIAISWKTIPGRSYILQGKNSLNTLEWAQIIPAIHATAPSTTVSLPAKHPTKQFYRVLLLP